MKANCSHDKIMTPVTVEIGTKSLRGNLVIPNNATGLVLFAHGSGSSRRSPRNKRVADTLNNAGLATLLIDLLTEKEEWEGCQVRAVAI